MSQSKVLFMLSGSIACYKACEVISRLVQHGHEVQTVATRNTLQFVGTATLEGLSGKPCFSDVYETGKMMDHIRLSRWADVAVLCPATANSINKLASGIADDALGNLFLSFERTKPFLVFPAMNKEMLSNPATQSSISKLRDWGVHVFPTGEGYQACGEKGEGRLMEPPQILEEILVYSKGVGK